MSPRPRHGGSERGVILISALVLVALAAVVAAALFFDTGMLARRAAANNAMEQALQLGEGAEALAAWGLAQDQNSTDAPHEAWAQPAGPFEVAPEVSLEARLSDLQGRFNLNTLVDAQGARDVSASKVFVRLLQLLQIDVRFADLLVDWLDTNPLPEQDGGEDSLYLSQQPQHRAANLPLTSTSELMQLPGFTRELYLRLAPHVTALPPSVRKINVCTADGLVLDALYALSARDPAHVEYSALQPEELAARRAQGCFPQRAVLVAQDEALQPISTESSSWFRLQSWIRIGTAQFALYSLMYRDNASRQVRPVARSLGTE
jgi:general secretion pathway protein K